MRAPPPAPHQGAPPLTLSEPAPPPRPTALTIAWLLLKVVAVATLPFALLLRGTAYLYAARGWPTWLAMAGGLVLTLAVLTLYLATVYAAMFGWRRVTPTSIRNKTLLAMTVLLGYCGFTQLFLSSSHAKTDEVRAEYRALHPILRLGVSTVILFDSELMVTDMARTAADYAGMGLPKAERSLHFKQSDGYVHAVDIRTNNRGRVRNALLPLYFRVIGLKTLRHVGTADHLHVSLPLPRRRSRR